MTVQISLMTEVDWPIVANIYQEGIDTGNATFASHPPQSWAAWCQGKIGSCSLVARENDKILGWAALSPVSNRSVYAGVAEVSIYISSNARGRRIGSLLLQALIHQSEDNGIWTLQAVIFPENEVSLQLHIRHGFRLVGRRERLGKMEFGPYQGQWRDVVFLERRSNVVGI
jgi:phosphinothricin acetyltransferase